MVNFQNDKLDKYLEFFLMQGEIRNLQPIHLQGVMLSEIRRRRVLLMNWLSLRWASALIYA